MLCNKLYLIVTVLKQMSEKYRGNKGKILIFIHDYYLYELYEDFVIGLSKVPYFKIQIEKKKSKIKLQITNHDQRHINGVNFISIYEG